MNTITKFLISAFLFVSFLGIAKADGPAWTYYSAQIANDVGIGKDFTVISSRNGGSDPNGTTGTGTSAGTVRLLDNVNGQVVWQYQPWQFAEVKVDAAWDANVFAVISSERNSTFSKFDYWLRVWTGGTPNLAFELKLNPIFEYSNFDSNLEYYLRKMNVHVSKDGKTIVAWMMSGQRGNIWTLDLPSGTWRAHKWDNIFAISPSTNDYGCSRLSEDGKLLVINSTGYTTGFHTDPLSDDTSVVEVYGYQWAPQFPALWEYVSPAVGGVAFARQAKNAQVKIASFIGYTRLDVDHLQKFPSAWFPEANYSSFGWWHWIKSEWNDPQGYVMSISMSPDGNTMCVGTIKQVAPTAFYPDSCGLAFYQINAGYQRQPALGYTDPNNASAWPARVNNITIPNPVTTASPGYQTIDWINNNTIIALSSLSNNNLLVLRKNAGVWGITAAYPMDATAQGNLLSFNSNGRVGVVKGAPIGQPVGSYLTLYNITP